VLYGGERKDACAPASTVRPLEVVGADVENVSTIWARMPQRKIRARRIDAIWLGRATSARNETMPERSLRRSREIIGTAMSWSSPPRKDIETKSARAKMSWSKRPPMRAVACSCISLARVSEEKSRPMGS